MPKLKFQFGLLEALAIIPGSVAFMYGLYTFGLFGSNQSDICVTNENIYHPYIYQNQSNWDASISRPGSKNVTSQFNFVISSGFIVHLAATLYWLFRVKL